MKTIHAILISLSVLLFESCIVSVRPGDLDFNRNRNGVLGPGNDNFGNRMKRNVVLN